MVLDSLQIECPECGEIIDINEQISHLLKEGMDDERKQIELKIKKGEDLFNRNIKYKAIKVDESFPKYILENKEYFKTWIV